MSSHSFYPAKQGNLEDPHLDRWLEEWSRLWVSVEVHEDTFPNNANVPANSALEVPLFIPGQAPGDMVLSVMPLASISPLSIGHVRELVPGSFVMSVINPTGGAILMNAVNYKVAVLKFRGVK